MKNHFQSFMSSNESHRIRQFVAIALFVAIGLLLTVSAHADGLFDIQPEHRLFYSSAAIVADTVTTYVGLRQGATEANPGIGRHPSVARQALIGGLKLTGNWYVETHTSGERQNVWTWFVIAAAGGPAINNMIVISRKW